MAEILQITAVGILTAVFAALLRRYHEESALLLAVGGCVLIGLMLVKVSQPVIAFLTRLRELTGLEQPLLEPLLKAVGIGVLTQISAGVCDDAKQSAVARLVKLCGGLLALYAALPLLEAVLELIETVGGG